MGLGDYPLGFGDWDKGTSGLGVGTTLWVLGAGTGTWGLGAGLATAL